MTSQSEIIENYRKHMKENRERELSENFQLILDFIAYCKTKGIELKQDQFDYIPTIGIVAIHSNLVNLLNNNVEADKEELVPVIILEKEFKKKGFVLGNLFSDKFIVLSHPYFRRGYYINNNYAPRFLEEFWSYNKPNNEKFISIDFDRVRINVDNTSYMELDTWFGAKFNKDVAKIEDQIIKLRPPINLDPHDVNLLFNNTYSLDIKWTSYSNIKVFQLEEFATESVRIAKNNKEYFPVKYIHAEFDCDKKFFRHFDGAIHFYTEDEYYQRRDEDLNFNEKSLAHQKTLSQKLFKINGEISTDDWCNMVTHYLTGDPLIFEYFEGKFPDKIQEYINNISAYRSENRS